MSLADIFNVSVSSTSRTPSRAGFGVVLLLCYHTAYSARVRSYTSLAGMVSDGLTSTTPAYQMASAAFAQNPRPVRVKVGRRATAFSKTLRLTPSTPAAAEVFSLNVNGTAVSATADGTPTLAEVCTALATAIAALSGVGASGSSGTHVDVTADTAGSLIGLDSLSANLAVKDVTANPGIAADLDAVLAADPDFYMVCLDSNSAAEIAAAAVWAEANGKLLVVQSSDSATLDGASTTDVFAELEAAAYGRTVSFYHPSIARSTSWVAAAMAGSRAPITPGSDTWAFKTLAGVAVTTLTDTQAAALEAKNANWYQTLAGVNVTYPGKVAAGEWADVVRFLDRVRARQREGLFALNLSGQKTPFTDAGVSKVRAFLSADIKAGQADGGFDPDATPTITVPKVADVSDADRAARTLPGVEWSMRLAGAIHSMTVSGTATP